MAEGLKYDELEKVAATNLHDFTGYYVLGKKDGAHALLMTLLDTQSSTNLLITIVFTEGNQAKARNWPTAFLPTTKRTVADRFCSVGF